MLSLGSIFVFGKLEPTNVGCYNFLRGIRREPDHSFPTRGEFSPNSEVEFLRWRSAAVPAAAKWGVRAVGKIFRGSKEASCCARDDRTPAGPRSHRHHRQLRSSGLEPAHAGSYEGMGE